MAFEQYAPIDYSKFRVSISGGTKPCIRFSSSIVKHFGLREKKVQLFHDKETAETGFRFIPRESDDLGYSLYCTNHNAHFMSLGFMEHFGISHEPRTAEASWNEQLQMLIVKL